MGERIQAVVQAGNQGGQPMTFTRISPSCQIPGLNKIYDKYFPGLTAGVFVEVGANDGYSWSNTWGLAETGWKGLYYEPVPEFAQACKIRHQRNNVEVIQACVGEFCGETELYTGLGFTTSSFVAQNNIFYYANSLDKYIISPAVSLNKSLEYHDIPNNFELLVVDVDGDETGVLKGLDLETWQPRMIIIETSKDHPDQSWRFNCLPIENMLTPYYDEIYHDHINSIFVRRQNKRKPLTMPSLFEAKRNMILKYAGGYSCRIFLETGTGEGDMIEQVYPYFNQVYSVELSDHLYENAVAKFANVPSVNLVHGDSAEVLPGLLKEIKEPALIYLDAHYCGGYSAHGSQETPILAELRTLLAPKKFKHVILIDDLQSFLVNVNYPRPDALKKFILEINKDLYFEIVGEGAGMMLVVQNGKKFDETRKPEQVTPKVILGNRSAAIQDKPGLPAGSQDEHRFERAPILYGPYRNPEGK